MIDKFLIMAAAKIALMFRGTKPTGRLNAVSDFELSQFLGCWRVALYIPQPLTKPQSCISITFTHDNDGTIKVVNRGYKQKKKQWVQEETLVAFKQSATIGWLVSKKSKGFEKSWKIVYLNKEYTQAILVGLTMRTFVIIYKGSEINKTDLDFLIRKADKLGFKSRELVWVDQSSESQD